MVALVVAQRRESGGRLSGIKLSALSIGLLRAAKMARKKKASVHLPCISPPPTSTGTELRDSSGSTSLNSRGIPTFIYYTFLTPRPPPFTVAPRLLTPLLPPMRLLSTAGHFHWVVILSLQTGSPINEHPHSLVNSLRTQAQLSKQTLWLKAVMVPTFTNECNRHSVWI